MHSYFVRHKTAINVANSATFYLQNIEIPWGIKKGPARLGTSLCLLSEFSNYSSTAAWAAARRAMGTRKGEQLA